MKNHLYIISFLFSLSLTFASCNLVSDYVFRKELSIATQTMNSQCPWETHYGTLQRVYVDGDTLCTLLRLADGYSYILNQPITLDPAPLTASLLFTLAEDTTLTPVADLAHELAAHNCWLRLRLDPNSPKSTQSAFLYASPALLDSVFNNKYSEKEKAIVKVQTQVFFAKCQMPIRLDDKMSMTAIDYVPGEVRMHYTIVEDEQVDLGKESFRTTAELVVRNRIWNNLIRSSNASVHEIVKNYYLSGSRVVYTCTGSQSGGQLTLVFTSADLRMLLSHYGIHL